MFIAESRLKKILMLFMIAYPIFDIKYFYNNITTLMRILIVLILFLGALYIKPESRKNIKYLIIYYFLIILYTALHHRHALSFKSLIPGNFNYSVLKEMLQIFKLTTPVLFIYTLSYMNITKKDIYKVVRSWIIIISGSIIILNILKLSLGSYSDELILGSIFTWFTKHDLTYSDLASKGLFMYANQISVILLLMLPIIYYLYLKKEKNQDYTLLIALMLSSLIIGTRIATVGSILLLVILLLMYLFFSFIIKEFEFDFKIVIKTLFVITIYIVMVPISPMSNRKGVYDNLEDGIVVNYEIKLNNAYEYARKPEFNKKDYILSNYEKKRIYDKFILESYPYQYDSDFWYDIMQLPINKRIDYRYLEIKMVKRVVEINDNPYDKYFGITNTRIQNIFNIERDFILHYYAYGLLGLILFLNIYLYIPLVLIKRWVLNINYLNSIEIGMVLIYLGSSYMSGNILSHLSTVFPFIFLISGNLRPKPDGDYPMSKDYKRLIKV